MLASFVVFAFTLLLCGNFVSNEARHGLHGYKIFFSHSYLHHYNWFFFLSYIPFCQWCSISDVLFVSSIKKNGQALKRVILVYGDLWRMVFFAAYIITPFEAFSQKRFQWKWSGRKGESKKSGRGRQWKRAIYKQTAENENGTIKFTQILHYKHYNGLKRYQKKNNANEVQSPTTTTTSFSNYAWSTMVMDNTHGMEMSVDGKLKLLLAPPTHLISFCKKYACR